MVCNIELADISNDFDMLGSVIDVNPIITILNILINKLIELFLMFYDLALVGNTLFYLSENIFITKMILAVFNHHLIFCATHVDRCTQFFTFSITFSLFSQKAEYISLSLLFSISNDVSFFCSN